MPMESGQNLLHYRLVDKLGAGGMGEVWRAVDTSLERQVAIKVTHGLQTERQRSQFASEAQALATMGHPNVASLYDFGSTDDGTPFVVMELIEGATTIVE